MSLQCGHRISYDIDLFTDVDYGSIDFNSIDKILRKEFPFVESNSVEPIGLGKMYFIGNTANEMIKLDLFYTERFLFPIIKRYTSQELIEFFKQKYPYIELSELYNGLTNFEQADNEADPNCLRGRYWELIKANIVELVKFNMEG